ncbi:MAG: AMP-binding protein [Woeseiaceae bacterium]
MSGPPKSYAHGGGQFPLLGMTVGQVLDRAAERWPRNEALVVMDQGIRWTWSELQDKAVALSAAFLRLGLRPGDRIGMLATNRSEWLVVQFATAYAGLILVNINPAYRARELEFALNKVGCRALITESSFKTSDYIAMLQELAPEIPAAEPGALRATRLPSLRWAILLGNGNAPGMLSFDELIERPGSNLASARQLAATLDFDSPINIQFTSGTTGTPKAATLTHHNIVNNAFISAALMQFTESDRLCVPVPMYHCFGMVLGTLLCASHGSAIVFPSAGFDASASLGAIAAERCTAIHGVPTMFISMLDDPYFDRHDLSSLRTGIMAGAPCPVELMRRVIKDMHLQEITIGYGMTETGPLSTQTLPQDPENLRVTSVGRPLPHTEIKVVDDAGAIVPRGVAGELCTRGYCVMREYWNDPERTAADIDAAHWIRSGDIAIMDTNDYLSIVGRTKDMLIRGGENIYPREIEEFLYSHPKIEQAEVVGVPDEKFGEEICAWVRLYEADSLTEDELRDYCRGKLAHFKIPRYIRFVEDFPMTVTGKVQKFMIREHMAAELGLESGPSVTTPTCNKGADT